MGDLFFAKVDCIVRLFAAWAELNPKLWGNVFLQIIMGLHNAKTAEQIKDNILAGNNIRYVKRQDSHREAKLASREAGAGLRTTWLGHASYLVEFPSGGKSVWFAGDTGYRWVPEGFEELGPGFDELPRNPQFAQIGELRGSFDVGLIPIGAYHPRFMHSGVHASPYDAVEIFQDTRCRKALAMH